MFSIRNNIFKIIRLATNVSDGKKNCEYLLFQNIFVNHKSSLSKLEDRRKYSSITTNNNSKEDVYFDNIANGDKEVEHKLKVILLEAEVMRQEGKLVPEKNFLTLDHWKELLNMPSRTARKKYLEYLFKLSKKKENRKEKQLEKKLKREYQNSNEATESEENLEQFALQYDLSHNNIFLRFYESTINQMYNNRLIQAMMFGQKLVVDCGYEQNMTKRENINCAKQLMLLFSENRSHDDPFDLHYCNTNLNGVLMKGLHKIIPTLYETSFPLNLHQGSYLDLFPKDQLIYLTPHCRQEMTEFDHNAVYIIGAIVDKVNKEPLSLAKAKKEGLRMMKFPLDQYLQWGAGSGKNLTLNQVISVLNDIKSTGDWNFALRHVPKRKIIDYNTNNKDQKLDDSREFNSNNSRSEKRWIPSSSIDFKKFNFSK